MPDHAADIAVVKERISDANRVNQAIAPWVRRDEADAADREATKEVDRLTEKMVEVKEQETALIAGAGIPVEGLSFSEAGEPLLNGKPLSVASGAERIRMSVAVAMAANPDLRVCLIDEANDLGIKAMETLDEEAKKHNFQIIGCRLGLEGPGEIVVDDGRAWARDDDGAVDDDQPDDEDQPDLGL